MPSKDKKEAVNIPEKTLEFYDKAISHLKDIERKGVTMPYTSLNGHMFSYIGQDGMLALRLSTADREAFITKHKTALAEAHGVVMKEYVAVPDKLLKKTMEMQRYFTDSYNYIKSLKPNPTTKKKK